MEATGYSRWFERLLAELSFELWIGDPAEMKVKRIKKQKTAATMPDSCSS
jgi:transposase